MRRPALTKSMAASASSETTSSRRARVLLPPTAPRLSAKPPPLDHPDAEMAGVSPNTRLVTIAAPAANARTWMSTVTADSRGIDDGPSSTSARTSRTARPAPAIVPSTPKTRLSISSCAISWRRLAPSAARTDNSRPRAWARASKRLATFAQAMSRTSVTAPNSAHRVGRLSRTMRSCREIAISVDVLLCSRKLQREAAATVSSAVVACRGDTPSFNRASTCTHWAPRDSGARSCGVKISGCQNSAVAGNLTSGEATPTIVTAWPSSVVVELMTSGRPPNRRRQSP